MCPAARCVALSSTANAAWHGQPKRLVDRPPDRVMSGKQKVVNSSRVLKLGSVYLT